MRDDWITPRWRRCGESPEVVARVIGVNRSAIYGWLAQYRRGGWGALKAKPLFGRPPKLDGKTEGLLSKGRRPGDRTNRTR
jgi:transposase